MFRPWWVADSEDGKWDHWSAELVQGTRGCLIMAVTEYEQRQSRRDLPKSAKRYNCQGDKRDKLQ